MKFFFCEKCGKRVTDVDVESGQARDKQAKGVYCKDCAAGVMTMTFDAMNEQQARDHLKKELSSSAKLPPAAPARPPSRESQARMAPSFRKPAPKAQASPPNAAVRIAAGAAVALALFAAAWFAFSSKPREPARAASPGPQAPVAAKTTTEPAPVEGPAPVPPQPPVLPPKSGLEPSPAVAEKTREAAAVPAKTVPSEEKDAKSGDKPAPAKEPPPPVEFKDGLLVHMKFDGDLSDSGPLNLKVSCKNQACEFRDGIAGKAVATARSDNANVVSLPRHKALYASETFGVAFWVRFDEIPPKGIRMVWNHCRWGVTAKSKSIVLHLNGADKEPEFGCPALGDKDWHHVVLNWDGKSAVCLFDGRALEAKEPAAVNLKNNMTWNISILGTPWSDSLIGALDDFRLYNRPLTAEETAQFAKR